MSRPRPDPEAINLDVPAGEEGTATGYGILRLHTLICIWPSHIFLMPDRWPQLLFPAGDQASQRASSRSGPLFSMYVDMTAEQDRNMAKSWKGYADGVLVFVSPDITPSSLYVNLKHPRLVCSPLPLQR